MSVRVIGYVVDNKARVALERALRNPRKRVVGVEWESKFTFGFTPQGMGVRQTGDSMPEIASWSDGKRWGSHSGPFRTGEHKVQTGSKIRALRRSGSPYNRRSRT